MKFRRTMLNYGLAVATALGGSPAAKSASLSGAHATGGTVTRTDARTRSFDCYWESMGGTYQTTRRTVYRIGTDKGSWSDVKLGAAVSLKFHRLHGKRIADKIDIDSGSFK